MTNTAENPVPAPIQSLLAIFEEHLKDVHFPGVDFDALQEAAGEVRGKSAEVARLEAELAAARGTLSTAQETLLHKAQRALSYAKVFAEEDETVIRKLEEIGRLGTRRLPRTDAASSSSAMAATVSAPATSPEETAETGETPRRRGRPKAKPAGMLFQDTADGAAAP
jgi:hypothetical protein